MDLRMKSKFELSNIKKERKLLKVYTPLSELRPSFHLTARASRVNSG